MTIVTVLGSARAESLTRRVLVFVQDELQKDPEVTVVMLDPSDLECLSPTLSLPDSKQNEWQTVLRHADGIILATPEYLGSYSATMKMLLENFGYPSALAGKPVALLGVASGQLGATKALEHLRSICAHLGAIVLPTSVSVAHAHTMFDEQGRCQNQALEERLRTLGTHLKVFIRR